MRKGVIFLLFLIGCSQTVKDSPVSPSFPSPLPSKGLTVSQTEMEKRMTDVRKGEKLEELPVDQVEKTMMRFSFSVRDADIKDVLMALSKETPFNIVADPAVEGKVTADLKDVTLDQALDVTLKPLGLIYKVEDNLIKVSKPTRDMETRTFTVNYVTVSRTGTSSVAAAGGAGAGGAGSVSSTYTADLWTNIETELKSLVSTEGKISMNKMAGIVMVTDYPDVLERIDEYLKVVESSVHRQVLIQAEIIEVILSDDYQMGLDWSVLTKFNFRAVQNLSVGSNFLQVGVLGEKFSMLLDILSSQGKVNILSNPRISVLNGQKAIIKIGREDVYWKVNAQVEPTTGKRIETTSPQTITVGLVLDVTPQIGEDGTIIMHIHPSISEKTGESQSRLGDTMPIVEVREVDTVVRVENGQSLTIGGILQDKTIENITHTPLLSRIPYVGGHLFKRTKLSKQKSELLILLTPSVAQSTVGAIPQ